MVTLPPPITSSPSCVAADLIRAAIAAPSPDNNQPWLFRPLDGDRIEVHFDGGRRLPSDVHHMFDLTGLGAAIENMMIRASALGRRPTVSYADQSEFLNDGLVALLEWGSPSTGFVDHSLDDAIEGRITNRSRYRTCSMNERDIELLSRESVGFPGVQLTWLVQPAQITRFAKLAASTDQLRLEHQPFHAELFRQLRFDRSQVDTTRDGLDVRTLSLPVGGTSMLKWLRHWHRMEILKRFGLTYWLAKPGESVVRHSGAIGVLSVERQDLRHFLDGGRVLQRMWLQATILGYSVQPIGSVPIFVAYASLGRESPLSPGKQAIADRVARELVALTGIPRSNTAQICFRIGVAATPKVRSLRRHPADVIYQESSR